MKLKVTNVDGLAVGLSKYKNDTLSNTAFAGQPVKTFDFYIHVNLKVCIFDKTFSKQAAAKAHPLYTIPYVSREKLASDANV